jgi:DNA-nicking Smr family endonuclease
MACVPQDPDEPIELPIDGVLDLHTFRPGEVAELVQDYLDACQSRGILLVRIIHGKGKGTLRRTVLAALERRSDIVEHHLAPPERGGWGATLVTLRPAACLGGDDGVDLEKR